MKLITQTPKRALNKAFLKQRPLRSEIDLFKTNLLRLLGKVDEIEREENQKNHVRDFLRDTFYKESNEINTKDNKDLVIHLGKTNKDKVGVIIEAKRPSNKSEMLKADKPNAKALQELVLYYLKERIEENNIDIKYCVATNIYEWYIIEASYFEKLFFRDKEFVKEYQQWRDKQKVTSDTKLFYESIAKPFIDKLTDEIPCTYFDIRSYEKVLRNADKADDKNLIALLKILSPYHLLKVPFADDSNKLDENFYKELLHIIGLEEAKDGGKSIIRRKAENKNPASLLEMVLKKLRTKGIHKIPDVRIYGETTDEQFFNIALELCITWINRILFLKLLEGQLITYHKGDISYRFLNTKTIQDFDELFKLFHNVLAVNLKEREEEIKKKYNLVPYLNSSLFEISELEDLTISIDSLDNSETLDFNNTSILKELKKRGDKLKTLDYLFLFLDSYDFASEGSENIQEDNKPLINASVLGKVFEKINGYKDGSVFTPGYITMYMCRQSIRLSVIQKFNKLKKWNIKDFEELYNKIEDINEANKIIDDIKICDPAVGSGHFLVSALNELIAIKSELKILKDKSGKRLKEYTIEVLNDELIVTDIDGGIYEYNPNNKESQRVQQTLFEEKQKIIENCLFGVDINPNSVKICRLRLWIELLKNAYYKEEENYTELETLPNIDINIKHGNSLLSRFPFDIDLKSVFKQTKYSVESYKVVVDTYKNTKDRIERSNLLKFITDIKEQFQTIVFQRDPLRKKISDLRGQLMLLENNLDLFGKKIKADKDLSVDKKRIKISLAQKEKELEEKEKSKIYKNAFEWRFEFPEVLNYNGDFEGFDVIIGNPPYIEARSSVIDEKLKDEILRTIELRRKKDSVLITRGSDILIYFFELGLGLIKPEGYFSFITQNSWLDTDYGFKFQKFLKKNTEILGIFDDSIKYFDDSANINTIVTLFKGNSGKATNEILFSRFENGFANAPYKLNEIRKLSNLKSVKQSDATFDNIKWGIILNSDKLILDVTKRLFEKQSKESISYRIGQGLNITKDYIVSPKIIENLNLNKKSLISYFTNDDGAPFVSNSTINYLIDDTEIDEELKEKLQTNSLKILDLNKNSRKTPDLILPRGLGRYFAAINKCEAYSSSFVEIYVDNSINKESQVKSLWLFLNSTIGWLIREVSGRKNLGGGMLKAEAIDLKSYPLYFNFEIDDEVIDTLIQKCSLRENQNSLIEINSIEHKEIDLIVFKALGFNTKESIEIISKTNELINNRVNKSKTKI
jgi:adenine-specific DNA-methyltransferase